MTENVLDASLQSASSPMRQDTRKADFELDKFQELFVIHHICFVKKNDDRGHPDLARQ